MEEGLAVFGNYHGDKLRSCQYTSALTKVVTSSLDTEIKVDPNPIYIRVERQNTRKMGRTASSGT